MSKPRPRREPHQQHPAQLQALADRRIQAGAEAIASAVSYGLVHDLEAAIERNRTRGWADDELKMFRLESDDEVRAAWEILERARSRERGLSGERWIVDKGGGVA